MSDMMMGDLRRMARVDSPQSGPAGISPAARVLTARGERRLGEISVGDRVISRSSGMIRVASVARFHCAHAPIALAPHALGNGRPSELVLVSPSQPILLRDWRARLLFGAPVALAPAAALVEDGYISRAPRLTGLEMVRLCFDTPEVLYVGMLECAFEPEARASAA